MGNKNAAGHHGGGGASSPSGGGNHASHSEAMAAAHDHIKSQGYTISDENWQHHVAGTPKPGQGKTNRYDIPLHKNGKETNKYGHIQVYNKGDHIPKNYEVNTYVDSGKPTFKSEQEEKFTVVLKDHAAAVKSWITRRKNMGAKASVAAAGQEASLGVPKKHYKDSIDPKTFNATVKRIANMTDNNDHTRSIATAAKMLGMTETHKSLMKLDALHLASRDGLTQAMMTQRNLLFDKVMSQAKHMLPAAQYKALNSAF